MSRRTARGSMGACVPEWVAARTARGSMVPCSPWLVAGISPLPPAGDCSPAGVAAEATRPAAGPVFGGGVAVEAAIILSSTALSSGVAPIRGNIPAMSRLSARLRCCRAKSETNHRDRRLSGSWQAPTQGCQGVGLLLWRIRIEDRDGDDVADLKTLGDGERRDRVRGQPCVQLQIDSVNANHPPLKTRVEHVGGSLARQR